LRRRGPRASFRSARGGWGVRRQERRRDRGHGGERGPQRPRPRKGPGRLRARGVGASPWGGEKPRPPDAHHGPALQGLLLRPGARRELRGGGGLRPAAVRPGGSVAGGRRALPCAHGHHRGLPRGLHQPRRQSHHPGRRLFLGGVEGRHHACPLPGAAVGHGGRAPQGLDRRARQVGKSQSRL